MVGMSWIQGLWQILWELSGGAFFHQTNGMDPEGEELKSTGISGR